MTLHPTFILLAIVSSPHFVTLPLGSLRFCPAAVTRGAPSRYTSQMNGMSAGCGLASPMLRDA